MRAMLAHSSDQEVSFHERTDVLHDTGSFIHNDGSFLGSAYLRKQHQESTVSFSANHVPQVQIDLSKKEQHDVYKQVRKKTSKAVK